MNDTAGIGAFLAAVAGLGIILFLITAALWVLKSIGLSQMAKNRGIENPWLAWLPIADLYIMGKIVDEMNLLGMELKDLGLWFPVICILGGLLSGIPILGFLIFIGVIIFQIAFIYKLFSMYTDQAALFTVLSVFFAFLWPIFIFSLRNHEVLDSPSSPEEKASNDPVILNDQDQTLEEAAVTENDDGQDDTAVNNIGPTESEPQDDKI